MKQIKTILLAGLQIIALATWAAKANAQGMHFAQYYNAPLLLSPANTGLMPDDNYRLGFNYRNQWSSIPVPYKTVSAYADFQAFRNNVDPRSWLGLGAAFFNDKAGNGSLALNRTEAFVAYHLKMGANTMLSGGFSGAYVQRSVDYGKLTFDEQWDGMTFNGTSANGEPFSGLMKTRYWDVTAGLNLAIFPNENIYLKIGAGVAHLTTPKESFYNMENRLGMRPTGHIDLLVKAGSKWIVNPSVYYTNQQNASELVGGSQFRYYIAGAEENTVQLILGGYYRWQESVIGLFGLDFSGMSITTSYDFTASTLSDATRSRGALEIALLYKGVYAKNAGMNRLYNCPRF
jgi:type IX secretion system PorP/SprF family membrane protein